MAHGQPGLSESPMPPGRQRLIDAAEIEFSTKGFSGASVLAIAQRAGVKQPLLNFHFGGKEGLWGAVVERAYASAGEVWLRAQAEQASHTPLERLKALLRAFASINIRYPLAHGLVFMEVAQAGPRLQWLVDRYMRPFHEALDQAIEECTQAGLMKRYPKEHASLMMTGMLTAVQASANMGQLIYQCGPMSTEQAQAHAEQAIDALLHGMLHGVGLDSQRLQAGQVAQTIAPPTRRKPTTTKRGQP